MLTANLVHMAFFNQLDVIKTSSKPQRSLSSGRNIEWPQFPKLRLLRCPKFSPNFSPLPSGWVLPVAWPRAVAPEAEHRCSSQPAKAAIPWSSGLSRRRRPWMHRTKTAVASEGDIGGETSWGVGIPLWSVWRCWWFTDGSTFWWIIVLFVWKACPNICTNVWCCCLWTQVYCSYTLGRSFLDSRILV